jgi:hypothetical protein
MLTIKVKTIIKYLPIFLYHAVFALIVFANFPWGKFLIGWDAVNPEFNLTLNFQRSLFASWQENYGLGALTGHGFATQLPHTMIISILSMFLPLWAIRSVFIFLCLYLGGLGMFFFARLVFYKITVEEFQKKFSNAIDYICLLTALFYCLNLATVQMFYLPLEAFIAHFAVLPWLFWIIIKLAGKTDKKNLILFFIINFFASIQGFIPSLFVAYVTSLFLFAGIYMVINRFRWVVVKKSLLIIFLTFLINAYWLLPFGYYQISKGGQTENAYNNLMTTEDFILKNKKYGNLENVALMKGFSFDMQELGGYVFQPWIAHYNNVEIKIIGYSLFVFVLVSAVLSLILIRHVLIKISVVIFLYFLASLATDSPLFSTFTKIMQTLSPSYYQAFRTAFTKFALGYSFLFSLFLGLGLYILLGYSYRLLKHKVISLSVFLGLFFLIIYYAFPVFKGNLLYKKLQVNIPPAYFEVMDFFKDKGDGRIADFPQDCPEGWYGYKWGYFGSGFYWYGIKQPILARTFDVWNPNNENYYWEVVQAIRSQDYGKVDQIMQKYDAKWIFYDPNLIHCRTARGFLGYDEFIKYLENSPNYRLVKTVNSGITFPIKIYENLNNRANSFIKIEGSLQNIGPKYNWNSNDKAYLDYQDYLTNEQRPYDVYYPFRSLFNSRKPDELEFKLEDRGEYFSFQVTIPKELIGSQLVIPPIEKQEAEEIDENDLSKSRELPPQIFLDGEMINIDLANQVNTIDLKYINTGSLEIRVPKIWGYYSAKMDPKTYSLESSSCDPFNKGTMNRKIRYIENSPLVRFTSVGSSNCLDFDLPRLTQKLGYLVTLENKNIEGKSLLFSVINKNSQRIDLETYLPKFNEPKEVQPPGRLNLPRMSYFIIPPMEEFGQGYTLHFDNISIGRTQTVNDLGQITVNPIPYRFLTSLKLVKDRNFNQQPTTDNQQLSVFHPNPSFYEIQIANNQLPGTNSQYLILSQSFDNGWHAYEITNDWLIDSWYMKLLIPIFGKEIKDHVLINNWENGWKISNQLSAVSSQKPLTIVLIYLPQYLEYLGFGLMGISFIYLLMTRQTKTGARD